MKCVRVAAIWFCAILLSACGGGGGGGGSQGGGFRVSLNRSSLDFQLTTGAAASSQSVVATWTGTPPDPIYIAATVEGSGIAPTIPVAVSESSAIATVSVTPNLAAGQYTGRINFLACADAGCSQRVGGTPLTVTYSITVKDLMVSPASPVSFQHTIGNPIPTPRTLAIASSAGAWTATAGAPWLSVSPASGNGPGALAIGIDPAAVTPGTHTTTLTVVGAAETQTVSVTLVATAPPALTPTGPVSFQYTIGTPAPTSQTLNVSAYAAAWTAAANAPWLTLSATSGNGAGTLTLGLDPSALTRGTHTTTLTLTSALATQSIPITVTAQMPSVQLSHSTLNFAGVNGSAFASTSVNLGLSAQATLQMAASANQPWIVVSSQATTAPGQLSVGVDPAAANLASGTYAGTVRVRLTSAAEGVDIALPVSLTLSRPTLTVTPAEIVLGGPVGRTFDQLPVNISLNTGTTAHPWSVSTPPSWLQLNQTSGTVQATPASLLLEPVRDGVDPGTLTTPLTFTATVNGDTVTKVVPVSFNLDTHRLLASETGVAFTSTPTWTRLTRTLKVRSSFGLPVAWTATSTQPWLTATASGISGDNLVLSADPSSLMADQLYEASITLTSSDTTITNPEVVRVGLWVGSTVPASRVTIDGIFPNVKSDPIRPYFYTHNGGTALQIYNTYTGTLIATIPSVAPALGEMSITPDGRTLYVHDTTNNRVVPVDLATRIVGTPWQVTNSGTVSFIKYVRPNGVGIVLTNNGSAFSTDGTRVGNGPFGYFDATADGKSVFVAGSRYDIDYTSADAGKFTFESGGGAGVRADNHKDTAASADGSRVYSASGWPYVFPRYNGLTFALQGELPGNPYPNNVEMGSDGRIFCASSNWYDAEDIWVYDANGFLHSRYLARGYARDIRDRSLAVSADSFFVIVSTVVPNLQIIPVGP